MKRIEADVGIIAAGLSGLAAAISAAETGAQVVVFEKAGIVGGSANMGMGPLGIESRLQKFTQSNLTKEKAYRILMDYGQWKADAKLVHDFIFKSGETIDWLEAMGVKFFGVTKTTPESEATGHIVMPDSGMPGSGCAATMIKKMYSRAQDLGVKFFLNTPVTGLRVEDGEVIGFFAQGEDGEEYEVDTGASIVCTGGCGTNPEMLKEQTGYTLDKDLYNFKIPGIVGEGIRMAWGAGAGHTSVDIEKIVGQTLPGAFTGSFPQTIVFLQKSPLVVNKLGYRVCDEAVMSNYSVAANIIDRQPGRYVYNIIDSNILAHFREKGLDVPNNVFPGDILADFEEAWSDAATQHPDCACVADSLDELAEKLGMNAGYLKETVATYNSHCLERYDGDFDKPMKYLTTLKGPKYFAYRVGIGAYGTMGGIRVNHKLEVITDGFETIPGLYGAGTDVCNIYAGTYNYYMPGGTMAFCLNSGRIAGENAGKFAQE